MSVISDLKILSRLVCPARGKDHQERLEAFYGDQADGYDDFRKRLLPGRNELITEIPFPRNAVWIDMGAGTGANLEPVNEKIPLMKKVYLIDLCQSLLGVADKRINAHNWGNVETKHADVTTIELADPADVISFSYSLTMIPDWHLAIENALKLLKPGGIIAVVDFTVSRKYPPENVLKHGFFTRNFWPLWFSFDNVFLNADHIPFLLSKFTTVSLTEGMTSLPYVPFSRVPYYRYIGRKKRICS